MNAKMQVARWLYDLSQQFGREFKLDEQGKCFITTQCGLELVISASKWEQCFFLTANLLKNISNSQDGIFQHALSLNLYREDPNGFEIVFNQIDKELQVSYSGDVQKLDFIEFRHALIKFIDSSEAVRNKIETSLQGTYQAGCNSTNYQMAV